MIPRITKGTSARAALAYDFGPGRREEHVQARTVAASVPGEWRDQAALIDACAGMRPQVERPIWRSALRAAPEDPVLGDETWGRIAASYIEAMGYADTAWTATRHGDDHIHLTVSRVDWEGRLVSDSHDYARAQRACRAIEVEHHLFDASTRYRPRAPQVVHGERERAARLGVVPERERLREQVDAAVGVSGGRREAFEAALAAGGVLARANVASTGRVHGYSYAVAGHLDAAGGQVWFKGSQLGRDYTWKATEARLQAAAPAPAALTLAERAARVRRRLGEERVEREAFTGSGGKGWAGWPGADRELTRPTGPPTSPPAEPAPAVPAAVGSGVGLREGPRLASDAEQRAMREQLHQRHDDVRRDVEAARLAARQAGATERHAREQADQGRWRVAAARQEHAEAAALVAGLEHPVGVRARMRALIDGGQQLEGARQQLGHAGGVMQQAQAEQQGWHRAAQEAARAAQEATARIEAGTREAAKLSHWATTVLLDAPTLEDVGQRAEDYSPDAKIDWSGHLTGAYQERLGRQIAASHARDEHAARQGLGERGYRPPPPPSYGHDRGHGLGR